MTLVSLLQPLLFQAALPIRDHNVFLIQDLSHEANKSKQKLELPQLTLSCTGALPW